MLIAVTTSSRKTSTKTPRRTAVSGKMLLLILGLSILAVATVLYISIVRLKLGGKDALRIRPAPATGASPSQ